MESPTRNPEQSSRVELQQISLHEGPRGADNQDLVPFKITRHSLYIVLLTLGFGVTKGVFSFMDDPLMPTSLELTFGVAVTIMMFYIGLYERVRPKRFEYFLHDGLSLREATFETVLFYSTVSCIYCYAVVIQTDLNLDRPYILGMSVAFCITLPFFAIYIQLWVLTMPIWRRYPFRAMCERYFSLCFILP